MQLNLKLTTMKNSKILQQNSTHKAILNTEKNRIEIWIKGLDIEDIHIAPEYLWFIPIEEQDDLFAIFERLDEDNRCNVAEFKAAMGF